MEKRIYDEKNGLWYELQGDYYIPCLSRLEEETQSIGVWRQRHLQYLKQHRRRLYTNLLISGKLNRATLPSLTSRQRICFFGW